MSPLSLSTIGTSSLNLNQLNSAQKNPLNANGDIVSLARTNPLHYTANGTLAADAQKADSSGALSFEQALLNAMDGVNAEQATSTDLVQQMIVDPDSVDAQDVTIAMAEANMSLNLAKTILNRIVTAWKDVINTR